MPEQKPYPEIAAQGTSGYPTTRTSTGVREPANGLPKNRIHVLRLAPGVWVIIHISGLCLWSGDSHEAAWHHIENGPRINNRASPLRRERANFTPKMRDTEFHTQDARGTT